MTFKKHKLHFNLYAPHSYYKSMPIAHN
uniref:Uncharacterized protein n=1 Tax=Arundo donax TaxID=35708 RepID=A0A0A9ACY3_ARUDO